MYLIKNHTYDKLSWNFSTKMLYNSPPGLTENSEPASELNQITKQV